MTQPAMAVRSGRGKALKLGTENLIELQYGGFQRVPQGLLPDQSPGTLGENGYVSYGR